MISVSRKTILGGFLLLAFAAALAGPAMAQSAPSVFHNITAGNNIVPCTQGTPNCSTGRLGYNATPGYDLATGLGSVDAYNLVTQRNSRPPVIGADAAQTSTADFTQSGTGTVRIWAALPTKSAITPGSVS